MAEDYSIVLTVDGDVVYRWDKPVLAPGSERVEGFSSLPLAPVEPLERRMLKHEKKRTKAINTKDCGK